MNIPLLYGHPAPVTLKKPIPSTDEYLRAILAKQDKILVELKKIGLGPLFK